MTHNQISNPVINYMSSEMSNGHLGYLDLEKTAAMQGALLAAAA